MELGILLTERCNARCAHCSTSCAPDKTTALPAAKILALMDEAATLRSAEDPQLEFCLSGGEPFLDFELLLLVVAHGHRLGAQVTCVSNAFWATSDQKARDRLMAVKAAGLSRLGLSTSRFHQQFVKPAAVQRALRIAGELKLPTVLKCAVTRTDGGRNGVLARWARGAGAGELELFPVVPYLRQGERLPEAEYLRPKKLPRGRCPGSLLTIREDGTAYSCGTAGAMTGFLAVGNAHHDGLRDLQQLFLVGGRQRILREKGPAYFARRIIAGGGGRRLRDAYAGVCDLCAHIAGDPELSAIAKRAADEFEIRAVRTALRRASEVCRET